MPLFVCSAKGLTSEEPGEQLPVPFQPRQRSLWAHHDSVTLWVDFHYCQQYSVVRGDQDPAVPKILMEEAKKSVDAYSMSC